MTAENQRANVAEELARSAEALRAAEALVDLGLGRDAMSRLYYALYHATLALLLVEGLEPTTHHGLLGQFGMHFIKTGRLPGDLAATLRRIQAYRESADYTRGFVLTEDECRRELDAGRAFVATARDWLRQAGFSP